MVSPPVVSAKARIQSLKVPAVALDPRFAGVANRHLLARVPRRRPHRFSRGRHHAQTICDAPCSLPGVGFAHLPIYGLEDLVPGTAFRAGWERAARPAPSLPSSTPPRAADCRSTPMAATSPA